MCKVFILFIYLYLVGCASIQEAGKTLRNEKVKTTDEFLVKKNEPLTSPPDLDVLPTPDSNMIKKDKKNNSDNIANILKKGEKVKNSEPGKIESLILDEIKK